jgi:hypothetical protein
MPGNVAVCGMLWPVAGDRWPVAGKQERPMLEPGRHRLPTTDYFLRMLANIPSTPSGGRVSRLTINVASRPPRKAGISS